MKNLANEIKRVLKEKGWDVKINVDQDRIIATKGNCILKDIYSFTKAFELYKNNISIEKIVEDIIDFYTTPEMTLPFFSSDDTFNIGEDEAGIKERIKRVANFCHQIAMDIIANKHELYSVVDYASLFLDAYVEDDEKLYVIVGEGSVYIDIYEDKTIYKLHLINVGKNYDRIDVIETKTIEEFFAALEDIDEEFLDLYADTSMRIDWYVPYLERKPREDFANAREILINSFKYCCEIVDDFIANGKSIEVAKYINDNRYAHLRESIDGWYFRFGDFTIDIMDEDDEEGVNISYGFDMLSRYSYDDLISYAKSREEFVKWLCEDIERGEFDTYKYIECFRDEFKTSIPEREYIKFHSK